MELPVKPKVVKKSARNSPIRKEPNSFYPPGKVAKKPEGKSPNGTEKTKLK